MSFYHIGCNFAIEYITFFDIFCIKRLVVIHVIDEEIELILADLKFYSKQLSKYLRKQKSLNSHYDFYLDYKNYLMSVTVVI